jgi:hypothetical protein
MPALRSSQPVIEAESDRLDEAAPGPAHHTNTP